MTCPTVLLVGDRVGATKAAARLGLRTLLVGEKEPGEARKRKLAGWSVVDFDAAPESVAEHALALGSEGVDAVVALTERATLPAALVRDQLGLPGVAPATARRCRDKVLMKRAVAAAGVPCAEPVPITRTTTASSLIAQCGLPLVIKRRDAAGGRDTTIARTRRDVLAALRPGWIAERFLEGAEMSIETLQASGDVLLVNPTEYFVVNWASILPAHLPSSLMRDVFEINRRALSALGLTHGISHLEVFLTRDGPVFGEVGARPPGGHLMELLAHAYGFCPWEAVLRIELGERPALPQSATACAGAWLLHPGPGVCRAVHGIDEARATEGVLEVSCRIRCGSEVAVRSSTANNIGRILVCTQNRPATEKALGAAHDKLRFEMIRDSKAVP
ncbi:MAG: ATP-grasp domain-containing protein [Planctomycetota bacterium]